MIDNELELEGLLSPSVSLSDVMRVRRGDVEAVVYQDGSMFVVHAVASNLAAQGATELDALDAFASVVADDARMRTTLAVPDASLVISSTALAETTRRRIAKGVQRYLAEPPSVYRLMWKMARRTEPTDREVPK